MGFDDPSYPESLFQIIEIIGAIGPMISLEVYHTI